MRDEIEAREALEDPGLLASFKSLRLNGGTPDVDNKDMLVTPEAWARCLNNTVVPLPSGRVVYGIDLGGTHALSAVACCHESGLLRTLAMFGGEFSLHERGRQDGTGNLYELAATDGELLVSDKRIPSVTALLHEAVRRWGMPDALIADRWRLDELADMLHSDRIYNWRRARLIPRGQGYKDGSSAVRAWRKAVVSQRVYPAKPCRLLTHQLSDAVVVSDAAANSKLSRDTEGGRRRRARDDVVAASLLAVEFGLPTEEDTPTRRRSMFRIVG